MALPRPLSGLLLHASLASFTDSTSPPTSNTPGPGEADRPARKWYRNGRRGFSHGGHPYELQVVKHDSTPDNPAPGGYDGVAFWPFVGALQPWKNPEGEASWSWDDFEGFVAVCGGDGVTVAQCTDAESWKIHTELSFPGTEILSVSWTYHPFTCRPTLAIGGTRLIYIVDLISSSCTRTLRGHGGQITSLTFAPNDPHILASTSTDNTTRIWNILGSDAPQPLPDDQPSENFPMADADEGTVVVAVLAGSSFGGHQAQVACAAFHPTKRAIATVSLDYTVKIWPLPPFPDPALHSDPTPRGYRPKVIYFPIFSTSRIHGGFLDWVEWLSHDVLVVRGGHGIVTWRWIGYMRYFRDGEDGPLSFDPVYYDYYESGEFMIIARYPHRDVVCFHKPALHRAWLPTPSELSRFPSSSSTPLSPSPNTVTDPLIASFVPRQVEKNKQLPLPEVVLFNPLLAEDGPAPEVDARLRWEEEDEEVDEAWSGQAAEGARMGERGNWTANPSHASSSPSADSEYTPDKTQRGRRLRPARSRQLPSFTSRDSAASHPPHPPHPPRAPQSIPPTDRNDMDKTAYELNPSLYPWRLPAVDPELGTREMQETSERAAVVQPAQPAKVMKQKKKIKQAKQATQEQQAKQAIAERMKEWRGVVQGAGVSNVAISPRGARWVVGVGEGRAVFVWKMRDA